MRSIHECECAECSSEEPNPVKERHRRINVLISRLDERQRRWYVATEADAKGRGGQTLLSKVTGFDPKTIRRGQRELAALAEGQPERLIRAPGGGRPKIEVSQPGIQAALKELLESETAGDPEGKRKQWVRASLSELKRRLDETGFQAGRETIRRMLHDMDYSLRLNVKTKTGKTHPQRDEQFQYIEAQKQAFLAEGQPVISVDTKKRN